MVHALREIWRVLVPGGILLDLRPLCASWPVEIVAGERVLRAGALDDSLAMVDDLAANHAVEQVVRDGWFRRERGGTFTYDWYWDTLDELKEHVEERWHPIALPDSVYAQAQRTAASVAGVSVRVRVHMMIGRYRKLVEPGSHL
jgi:hypothetical protein